MSISENLQARAVDVTDREVVVELHDGTRHSAPIALFPILADAVPAERSNWRLIGRGTGIHWPDIDEHISVLSVVQPERTIPMRPDAMRRHLRRNRALRTGHIA